MFDLYDIADLKDLFKQSTYVTGNISASSSWMNYDIMKLNFGNQVHLFLNET